MNEILPPEIIDNSLQKKEEKSIFKEYKFLLPIDERYWISRDKNLDSKTLESIETVRKDFNFFNDNKSLTLDSALDYLHKLKASEMKLSTLRKKKSHIKELFLANLEGNINELSKILDIKFSTIEIPAPDLKKKNKIIDKESISLNLENLSYKETLFVRFLYNTACRVSEMVEAEVNDIIDLGNGETQIGVIGKGRNGGKHGYLRISTDLYKEIFQAFSSPDIKRKYIFQNRKSITGKFSRQYIFKIIRKIKIGDRKVSPHNFRHSKASHMLKSGCTLKEVSEFLRHSSVVITSKFYDMNDISTEKLLKETL